MEQFEKTEKECFEILHLIFKDRKELLDSIAPNGWINSEFVRFFHPTTEQQYQESKRMTENINRIKNNSEKSEIKNIDCFKQDSFENINAQEEFDHILGLSVYDIFFNNHTVFDADNKEYNFGSFRLISDFFTLELASAHTKYDYMDFYMGSIGIKERAGLKPFYEFIFSILKLNYCTWQYEFPRLYAIKPAANDDLKSNNLTYNPTTSVLNQVNEKKKEDEYNEFEQLLNDQFAKDFEDAKYKPLNTLVQAYKNIYNDTKRASTKKVPNNFFLLLCWRC
jgi:hypothetical protein